MGFANSTVPQSEMGSSNVSKLVLKEDTIENFRPIKVRVIGAGYSGICLGVRIPQRIRNVDLQIYEKNDGVGGTWWENRYPGCACDVPSHSYQYSFATNTQWSGFYASATEIREYLNSVAEKYGVMRHVKLNHKVTRCYWDDVVKKWKITVENLVSGEIIQDEADVVVSCRGTLNERVWPRIPGLQDFKGELIHSSKWQEGIDLQNKKIALIGGGSSGVQLLPELQKLEGTDISFFLRSKSWIANPFFDMTMKELGLDPKILTFTEEQRREFAADPAWYLKFRKTIEGYGISTHSLTQTGSDMQREMASELRNLMKDRLSKKPEIFESLVPSFPAGCRRLTPGPGYLEALVQDNVSFYFDRISRIYSQGVELDDGTQIDLDVVICATGFDSSGIPPFEVSGVGGKTLQEKFLPFPETYASIATDGFPNYFMMMGPNAALGAGSLTIVLEGEADYIVKCIRKLQKEDYLTMMPKPSKVRDFTEFVERYFERTVYVHDCHSWYKNDGGKGDRIIGLWPGSTTHALEFLRAPRWEDFDYESMDNNSFRWLGNGLSACQIGGGDSTWYLQPEFVNFPSAATPEEDVDYQKRPYSQ